MAFCMRTRNRLVGDMDGLERRYCQDSQDKKSLHSRLHRGMKMLAVTVRCGVSCDRRKPTTGIIHSL